MSSCTNVTNLDSWPLKFREIPISGPVTLSLLPRGEIWSFNFHHFSFSAQLSPVALPYFIDFLSADPFLKQVRQTQNLLFIENYFPMIDLFLTFQELRSFDITVIYFLEMSSKIEGLLFAKSFLLLEISFQTPFILVNHSVRQTIFYFGIRNINLNQINDA